MKTIKQLLIVCALTFTFSNAVAQDANNPWVVSFGVNAVNAYENNFFKGEFYNAKDHWNIVPGLNWYTARGAA